MISRLRRAPHTWSLLTLAAMCLIVLWPAVAHLRTRWMLGTGDSSTFVWSWWAMPRALAEGHNPYQTDQIFYPVGVDLSLTTTTPLVAAMTWPLRAILGPVAQVNLVQIIGAWCAAAGAYALLHRLTRDRAVSVVGGLAFAFAPFRFVHLSDHMNLIHTGLLPVGVLLFLRFLDVPSRLRAGALGLVVGAAFLVEPQLAVLTLACIAPIAIVHRDRVRAQWPGMAVAGISAAVVSAPLLVPMVVALATGQGNTVDPSAMVVYSADPVRWLMPPSSHRVLGPMSVATWGTVPDEGLAYPGLAVLVLALASLWLVGRPLRRPWTAIAAVGAVMAMGPLLSYHGRYVDVPLPFMALRTVPGLNSFRVPGRFIIVGILGLTVLAALALAELSRRRPQRRWLLLSGVLAVMAVDLWPVNLPSRSARTPDPYRTIAGHGGEGAVLEIPLQWSTGEVVIGDAERNHGVFMEHATVHGRPLVGGAVSRYPDDKLDHLLAIPVFRQVLALQGEPGFDDAAAFTDQDLRDLGIGYVVYHRGRPMPDVLAYAERLDLAVLADDGDLIVWEVPTGPDR